MTLEQFKKLELPDTPGVYLFKDQSGAILYIGKATSLRDRVRSYFSPDLINARGQLLVDMVNRAEMVDVNVTDSVLEALLLEANLIKIHQPKFNTKEKDNKSHNYVVITNEKFPKVLLMRGRIVAAGIEEQQFNYVFGPFPHGAQLREAMKIIRRIFPFSDEKCTPCEDQKASGKKDCRPCFNHQIGLCPGVCTGAISEEEYGEIIEDIKLLFIGKKKELLKKLEGEMTQHAERQEFEKAARVRQMIFGLTHIQDVALLKHQQKVVSESTGGVYTGEEKFRIEAYDVAHSSGKYVVGVMTVVEDGELAKSQYRKFRIRINPGVNDTGALKEILRRRLAHLEWRLPRLIVVDGAKAQINAAEAVLKIFGFSIPVVSVVKDIRHKPRGIMGAVEFAETHKSEIILANSEAHRFAITYHRKKRDSIK